MPAIGTLTLLGCETLGARQRLTRHASDLAGLMCPMLNRRVHSAALRCSSDFLNSGPKQVCGNIDGKRSVASQETSKPEASRGLVVDGPPG